MQSVLDRYLGIDPQALTLESQRLQVLASNLANVDTPNYKAQDIDFKAALAAADPSGAGGAALPLTTTHPNDLTSAGTPAGASTADSAATASPVAAASGDAVKYRVPLAPSLDGNTVDEQLEQSAFAENSVRYQATLSFLNNKLRLLMSALSSS